MKNFHILVVSAGLTCADAQPRASPYCASPGLLFVFALQLQGFCSRRLQAKQIVSVVGSRAKMVHTLASLAEVHRAKDA